MKKIIHTKNAPSAIGPYNQAVLNDNILYTSGQIAIDPVTGNLIIADIRKETKQVMENLKALLEVVEMDFSNVLKATIFISDMDNYSIINEIYASYFEEKSAPARETVEVSRLPKSVRIEISMIAAL
ncbi:MAG: Rid family detoxifying hydrolase [Flavobacteriaceae bacterium]|nr:Rid family detoxifying hydrolase [Flavobacteriaceae bacterium]MDG1791429.1 Rid family detoxifying hydrolase [Flavobacteriaceae bacterium]MDG2446707.1 Rid family detoxifying hydrolase [Flavobacteriaceae bacterium]